MKLIRSNSGPKILRSCFLHYMHIVMPLIMHSLIDVAFITSYKNIGFFCKRDLRKRPIFCKETYIFKHPTHRSHPIALLEALCAHIVMPLMMYCSHASQQHRQLSCATDHMPRLRDGVLQCVAVRVVCCSQCVAVCSSALQCVAVRCSALQCVAVRCSALQCVAVCCSVLPCVAVCCIVLQ